MARITKKKEDLGQRPVNKGLPEKKKGVEIVQAGRHKGVLDQFIEKNGLLLCLTITLIISLLVFRDFYFLRKIFLFKDIGSDSINVDYPWMMLMDRMKTEQGFFSWTFYSGLGYAVFSGFIILLNPYILTNLLTEPLFSLMYGNNPAFLKFPYFIFHLLLIAAVSYYYFRTIGLSKFSNIIGSLLISFMGYTIACSSWNSYLDVFYGIFLLFSFEQLYRHNRWYFFPIAVLFLTGNFFNVYIYGVFLITYMLFRFFSENSPDFRKLGTLSLKMAGLTVLGLGLNAVNYATNLINAIDSPRATGTVSLLGEAAENPLMANVKYQLSTALLRLFSSDITGTADQFKGWYNYLEAPLFYCGLICILLVAQLFTHLSKREKLSYGLFLGFWFFVVLIPDFRHMLHLFLGEYYKVGINFFIPFVLIFFAVQALSRIEKTGKIKLPVLLVNTILIFILLFLPYEIENISMLDKNIRNRVLIFIVLYSFIIYLFSNSRFSVYARPLALLLIIVELSIFSNTSIGSRQAYSAREFKQNQGGYKDNTIEALDYIKSEDRGFYRIEKDYFSGNAIHSSLNDAQAQGYYGTTLYSSFNQPAYIQFLQSLDIIKPGVETHTRWAPGFRGRPLLQTFASVKYNLSKSESPFMLNAGYQNIEQFGDVKILLNEYHLPFGFSYDSFILQDDFDKLSSLQKDIALLRAYIPVDNETSLRFATMNLKQLTNADTVSGFNFDFYRNFTDQRRKDSFQITEFKHDKIKGTIKADSACMLFFSIPYDKYWKAKVNGKMIQPEQVSIGFMGLPLEKGEYEIELYYLPDYFYMSLIITIIANLLFIVLFFVSKELKLKAKLIIAAVFVVAYLINYLVII